MAENGHGEKHYIKVWAVLLVLLAVSIVGPMFGIKWLMLVTAFGIAFVKAYLVAREFMHINLEQPFVRYFVGIMLVFMVLFFAGTSPDVMKHEGTQWENVAAKHEIERALAEQAAEGEGHHEKH